MFRYVIILIVFFIVAELFSRVFFSNFNYNNISYNVDENHKVIRGKNIYLYKSPENENLVFRVKSKNSKLKINENFKNIFFIGDSVTLGFATEFDKVYYNRINFSDEKINILPMTNLGLSSKDIFKLIDKDILKIINESDILIYQFNYNDIVLETPAEINTNPRKTNLISFTQKFRYKYLNYSTFFKVLQYYASLQTKKLDGSCEERGIHSLGMYSFSFFNKSFEKESRKLWVEFENQLLNLRDKLKKKNIKFAVLISPISLQIENQEGVNKLKLNLKCSLKDGRKNLINILKFNQIDFIDPYVIFNKSQKKEKKILFHEFDTNHPNEYGHLLISRSVKEYLKID